MNLSISQRLLLASLLSTVSLSLCSCRSTPTGTAGGSPCPPAGVADGGFEAPMMGSPYPPGMELGVPQPMNPCSPWRPDGLPCPWPQDEYVCDGGDANRPAGVTDDWQVRGLDTEDSIVHYDTLDGRTVVVPSNRVCIYAPRFGAVRLVTGLVVNDSADHVSDASQPTGPTLCDEKLPPLSSKQQVQPLGKIAARPIISVRSRQYQIETSTAIKAREFEDSFVPFEDMAVIRTGLMQGTDRAMLAKGAQAAIAWTNKQAVQVMVDQQSAVAVTRDQSAQETEMFETSGHAKVRVIKIASTPFAEPGDLVHFTIRFDNVGTQAVGNVTILDNLSPRLELVDGSAQCSRGAKFFTEPNAAGSVVVRCEVTDPVPAGDGGIIRFACKVR